MTAPPTATAASGASTLRLASAPWAKPAPTSSRSPSFEFHLAITNYPYFFTERCYSQQFPSRKILICDECHTLENQLLKFAELIVGQHEIEHFMPTLKFVPELRTLDDFAQWVEEST